MHSKGRLALAAMMICALSVEGSAEDSYEVPLTEYGQPDLQGSWGIRFSTPLERGAVKPRNDDSSVCLMLYV